jgi:hypothetical protein
VTINVSGMSPEDAAAAVSAAIWPPKVETRPAAVGPELRDEDEEPTDA